MNKIRIVLIALILSAIPFHAEAQYLKFTKQNNSTNKISIPEGEAWQLATSCVDAPHSFAMFSLGNSNQIHGYINGTYGKPISISGASTSGNDIIEAARAVGSIFVGPYDIIPLANYQYCLVFQKLVSTNSAFGISATSVVIPSAAAGDVDIKLEQSADNVTWTECLPGTYNSSTLKRFFRLRAVEK